MFFNYVQVHLADPYKFISTRLETCDSYHGHGVTNKIRQKEDEKEQKDRNTSEAVILEKMLSRVAFDSQSCDLGVPKNAHKYVA
jgi:hypothetical protein